MDLNSPTSLCMQVTVEKPKKVKHSAVCSATSLWGATPWGLAGLIANLKWSVSKVMTSGDILYELIVMCLIQHLTKSHFSKSFSFWEHYGIIRAGACSEASIQARREGHLAGCCMLYWAASARNELWLEAESTVQILDPHGWKNPVLQNVCLRSGRRSKFLFDCFNGPIEAIQAKENCQAKHSHPSPVAHVLSCRARDLAAIDWFRFSFPLPRVDRQNLQTSLVGRSTDHTPCSQHTKYILKKKIRQKTKNASKVPWSFKKATQGKTTQTQLAGRMPTRSPMKATAFFKSTHRMVDRIKMTAFMVNWPQNFKRSPKRSVVASRRSGRVTNCLEERPKMVAAAKNALKAFGSSCSSVSRPMLSAMDWATLPPKKP